MRKFLFLFIFSTSLLNYTHAQIGTQKDVLTNTAKSLEVESRSNFSEAIIKSKQKGWPLEYKSKDNQTSSLIGIDKFGLPIYLTTYADPVQAITVNTLSMPPAPPNKWPVMDLVELTVNFLAWSPKAALIALVSLMSPRGVDVPWALR